MSSIHKQRESGVRRSAFGAWQALAYDAFRAAVLRGVGQSRCDDRRFLKMSKPRRNAQMDSQVASRC